MSASSQNEKFIDYYTVLGVNTDAGLRQLREAYLQMAKVCHPDAGGSTEKMQLLNRAYKTLAVTTSRAAYDMLHNFHTGSKPVAHYKEDGSPEFTPSNNMTDEYVDFFLDQMYNEFHTPAKQKPGFAARLKKIFKG